MNFHKTIGYLAALLLMVGFGVPDSFAQDVNSNRLGYPTTIADNADPGAVIRYCDRECDIDCC